MSISWFFGFVQFCSVMLTLPSFFHLCSSLYFDEDGDLAHEFYEETVVTKNGRKKAKLKRIHKNLVPQVSRRGNAPQHSIDVYQSLSFANVSAGNHQFGSPLHPRRFSGGHL